MIDFLAQKFLFSRVRDPFTLKALDFIVSHYQHG